MTPDIQCVRCLALRAPEDYYKRANGTLRRECKACTKADSARNGKTRKRVYGKRVHRKPTHCRRGHEFTPANTIVARSGKRQCRACKQLVSSARLAKAYGADLADKPAVTRVSFRVVIDPVTAAIFGGRK